MPIYLSKLDKEKQLTICSSPYYVSSSLNPQEEKEGDFALIQEKFLTLSGDIQDKLASTKTEKIIQQIGNSFNLSIIRMASIARAVRNYYFGTLPLQKFPQTFSQEMGIELSSAEKVAKQVIEKIINDDSFEKAYQQSMDELSFKEALKKYPALNKQSVTSNSIQIKNTPHSVAPSVENWIADYVFHLGYGKHDAIQRSRYLFQGKNSHTLSEADRQKMAFILKSFDENSQVRIDKNKNEIIFPEIALPDLSKVNLAKKNFNLKKKESKLRKLLPAPFKKKLLPQPKKETASVEENVQKTEFDFPQKMPFENQEKQSEIVEKKLSPYRIVPLSKKEEPASDEETFHIERKAPSSNQKNSKNIVNLREL